MKPDGVSALAMNPAAILFCLVLLMAFWHLVFIKCRPLNELGWKVMDYAWIPFSLLTVFSLSTTVRTDWYSVAAKLDDSARQARLKDLEATIDASVSRLCGWDPEPGLTPKQRRSLSADYRVACASFRELRDGLDFSSPARKVGFLLLLPDSLTDRRAGLQLAAANDELDRIAQSYENFLHAIQRQEISKRLASRSDTEAIAAVFALLFLLLAVSLRLTKVTGEVRLQLRKDRLAAERKRGLGLVPPSGAAENCIVVTTTWVYRPSSLFPASWYPEHVMENTGLGTKSSA